MICTQDHDALKHPERWPELQIVGVQTTVDGPALELRACPECRTTLAIEIEEKP